MGRSGELKNEIQRPASFMPALGPALGRPSPIGQTMSGHRGAGRKKRDMDTPLLLTALVDAFSILVIFLLVQVTASQSPFDPSETIKLPQASRVDGDKKGDQSSVVVLNIENGRYNFDNLIKNDARLALLENENKNSPYYRYVIAELILHKAYSRIKFKQYVKAALEIRKAFKMLEENKVLFPEFKPTLKNLGMLHCVMASVPQNYKWIAGMVGLNGTLEGGIAEMNELLAHIVSKKEYDYMHNETLMWLIFIETHLNKQASKSL